MADPEREAEGIEEIVQEFESVMAGEPVLADADLLYHLVTPGRS